MEFNKTVKKLVNLLVLIECGLLMVTLFHNIESPSLIIVYIVDLITSILIFITFILGIRIFPNKKKYFMFNFLKLFTSIPLIILILLNIDTIIIKIWILVKILVLLRRELRFFIKFIYENHLDKILIIAITIILFSVFIFTNLPPLHLSLVDSFWFVIISVTTVGYGDIVPVTSETKILAMILVILGFLSLSILSGSISAAYSNNTREKRDYFKNYYKKLRSEINRYNDEVNVLKENIEDLNENINEYKEEINDLNNKIDYLTKIIEDSKNNKD